MSSGVVYEADENLEVWRGMLKREGLSWTKHQVRPWKT